MTQPPDDETQRFDPYRDDDSTRRMPPVPPGGGDDDRTQFFGFGDDGDDRTRRIPPADDATRAMPRAEPGPARGSAVPPVYGSPRYDEYGDDRYAGDEYGEEPPPERSGKRLALIAAGVIAAVLVVVVAGIALGSQLFGGSPATQESPTALPSVSPTTASPTPSETASPESPPPPEGPGPRVLDVSAPATADCTHGGTVRIELDWRVADADRVDVSMDGDEIQQYGPDDAPVTVPFPCDGQAHKYQVTAFANNDRQSQPNQVTVRPEVPPSSPPPSLLFPSNTP